MKSTTVTALALGLVLFTLLPAQAQPGQLPPPQSLPGAFRMPGQQQQLANQPVAQTQVASPQPTTYPMGNFNYNPGLYGGYGMPGYYGGYYPGQVGGALQGVAAVTSANANYYGQIQNARLQKSYANQSALDYRRKALEEWKYEQSMKLSPEDIKAAENAQALRRPANPPP